MRRSGPVATLLVGLALAVIVLTLSVRANRDAQLSAAATDTTASAPPTTPATTAPPETAPPETAAPAPPPPEPAATYAGRVDGGGATVAIAVSDGQAVAYVCDGRAIEAWLQGPASGGTLALTGADGASLTGTYGNGVADGSVAAGGKQWAFSTPVVPEPAGLYRGAATVAGARVVGGWIVLANGTQVGVVNTEGQREPAPPLDVSTGLASVDGASISAELVGAELVGTGLVDAETANAGGQP